MSAGIDQSTPDNDGISRRLCCRRLRLISCFHLQSKRLTHEPDRADSDQPVIRFALTLNAFLIRLRFILSGCLIARHDPSTLSAKLLLVATEKTEDCNEN